MVPYTRRRTLQGATALLAGLAGCGGTSSMSGSSNEMGSEDNVEPDPPNIALRHHRNEPPIWIADREDAESTPAPDRPWRDGKTSGLIVSDETAEQLRVADLDGWPEVLKFIRITDFSRETLLLDANQVGECYDRELCYVSWSDSRYHTYYARHYRDATVACSPDAHDGMSHLIRIPDTLVPSKVTGRGSGTTSGSCHEWKQHYRDRQRSDASGSEPASHTNESGGK